MSGLCERGIQDVSVERGVFGKGERRQRCAGRGEEAALGKTRGKIRQQVGFDPQAGRLSGIAAEGEEFMESAGGPCGLGRAKSRWQCRSKCLVHGGLRLAC